MNPPSSELLRRIAISVALRVVALPVVPLACVLIDREITSGPARFGLAVLGLLLVSSLMRSVHARVIAAYHLGGIAGIDAALEAGEEVDAAIERRRKRRNDEEARRWFS